MHKINVNKDDIKEFDSSKIGQNKNYYLKRATITGIILLMFALLYLIFAYINNGSIYDYIIVVMSFLFGLYFIVNSKRIKYKEVNKFKYSKKD